MEVTPANYAEFKKYKLEHLKTKHPKANMMDPKVQRPYDSCVQREREREWAHPMARNTHLNVNYADGH